jgi:regulator of nonsense transcripts 2
MVKTLEQAAIAVDEMFNSAYQAPGTLIYFFCLFNSNSCITGDSGEDSEDESERRNEQKRGEEDAEELGESDSPVRHNTKQLILVTDSKYILD